MSNEDSLPNNSDKNQIIDKTLASSASDSDLIIGGAPIIDAGRDQIIPETLSEFIRFIYEGNKINSKLRKKLYCYDDNISERDLDNIYPVIQKNDKDYKLTLYLAELALEGKVRTRNRDILISFVENVVSNIAGNEKQKNTIFEHWLKECESSAKKESYFSEKIEKLVYIDEKGKREHLSNKARNNIHCIAGIWLFYKNKITFSKFLMFLSSHVFNIEGEKGKHLEYESIAFITSMVSSSKKKKLAYLLSIISKSEESLISELSRNKIIVYQLEEYKSRQKLEIEQLINSINAEKKKVANLEKENNSLKYEIIKKDEQAKHADIHFSDSHEDLKVKFSKMLEKEIGDLVNKAKVANTRTPPKTEIVDHLLNNVLEVIEKELKCLKP